MKLRNRVNQEVYDKSTELAKSEKDDEKNNWNRCLSTIRFLIQDSTYPKHLSCTSSFLKVNNHPKYFIAYYMQLDTTNEKT